MKIDLDKILQPVCNIAIEAGLLINTFYEKNINITIKEDNSPLTNADLGANKLIIDSLKKLNKDIPILTEESLVDWSLRKKWKCYWLVDPLDGTKEFIKKNGEFTVNIALIENNYPVMGVIYAPAFSELYYASKNKGTYKLIWEKELSSLSKSKKLFLKPKNINDKIKIFGSRSHKSDKFDNWIQGKFLNYELIRKGSSIKFCKIAEGEVDIYPRFGPTSEWDIAAGHIILTEAGGKIKSIDQQKIIYNKKESVTNPPFLAYGDLLI